MVSSTSVRRLEAATVAPGEQQLIGGGALRECGSVARGNCGGVRDWPEMVCRRRSLRKQERAAPSPSEIDIHSPINPCVRARDSFRCLPVLVRIVSFADAERIF